jgi:hypothetical protein
MNKLHSQRIVLRFLLLSGLLGLGGATSDLRADDRNLVEAGNRAPDVMILLDVSGSMHQSVQCAPTDIANGVCQAECDSGNCQPRLNGDDPDSKMYQAKSAIYSIMAATTGVNFGFASFDEAGLHDTLKYWWYSLDKTQPGFITLQDGTQWPAVGQQEVFGQQTFACNWGAVGGTPIGNALGCNGPSSGSIYAGVGGAPLNAISCGANIGTGINGTVAPTTIYPSHLDNAWEAMRLHRYPKLGDGGTTGYTSANTSTSAPYIQYFTELTNNTKPVYKVTYTPVAGQILGSAALQVTVQVDRCTNTACTTVINQGTKTMTWDKQNEFIWWENPSCLSTLASDSSNGGADWWGYGGVGYCNSSNGSSCNSVTGTTLLQRSQTLPGGATLNPVSTCPNADCQTGLFCGNCGFGSSTNASYIDTNFDTDDCYNDGVTSANSNCVSAQGNGVSLGQPTTADPQGRTPATLWSIGDMIPLDWLDSHHTQIMQRMAPNLLGGAGTPDFGISDYFADHLQTNESALRLKNNVQRPLGPDGGTPTGGAMQGIVDYLATTTSSNSFFPGFLNKASNPTTGDPNFNCKSVYLIIVTDGLASDGSNACTEAATLRTLTYKNYLGVTATLPVRTYVVGMGQGATITVPSGYTNTLQCSADNGGTGNGEPKISGQPQGGHYFNDYNPPVSSQFPCVGTAPCDGPGPLLVNNGSELVTALTTVLNLISGQSTAFAAAAVPAVQADVNDKVVISTFLPVNEPIWPGSVQAYLAPVPTTTKTLTLPNGASEQVQVPDPSITCPGPNPATGSVSCLLWDAAAQLLTLTPSTTQLASDDYNLDTNGTDGTKRRTFYSVANPKFAFTNPTLPNERDALKDPSDTAHWTDLLFGMSVCAVGDSTCGGLAANQTSAKSMLRFFYEPKQYADPNSPSTEIPYILGDIFHSNPQVLGNPENFTYFSVNLNKYSTFSRTQRYRRKVLFVGANDGALHAFDIGLPHATGTTPNRQWTYDDGTGNELFSYVPRQVMPTLNTLAIAASHGTGNETYMVDGTVSEGDVYIQPNYTGTLSAPEWRTVLIGGLREGGSEYYAIDVTQPDKLQSSFENPDDASTLVASIPVPNSTYVPSCLTTSGTGSGCGSTPYATPLWEFDDTCPTVSTCTGATCVMAPCDEDANGSADLGQTWSTPVIGRILVCDGGTRCNPAVTPNNLVDKYVAIFGGGMDPAGANHLGNFLYMVDIQTGKVLYKRALTGSVPSDVAAVDTNQDGYIDTIYVGTTSGFLYKVDLTTPPQLKDITGIGHRVDPTAWVPLKVFDTGGRPIYYPPAVVFMAGSSTYALAFGTGNRQDLWAPTSLTARFYFIEDTGWTSTTTGLPLTATNYQQIAPDAASQGAGTDFVDNPPTGLKNGWYFELGQGERIVDTAFVLSGVLIFSSYQPQTQVVNQAGKTVCADTGNTRLFVVNALQGDPFIAAGQPGGGRYQTITGALGGKVVALPPPPPSDAGNQTGAGTPPPPPANVGGTCNSSQMQAIALQLQKLFPASCRFSNYTINVNVGLSNTQMQCAAPIPVCIIEQDWKEY